MENTVYSNELQHHGTKGMRWGIRRYQNKDGSLTPAGEKRYNKEVEKLKKETAKVKEAEKAAANRKKTQSKLDKLEADKQKLEERKKALKGDSDKKDDDRPTETLEERKARLLKSSNPKELYDNKDIFSYQELNDRVNRIDLENRLQSKIPTEENKTAVEWMNKTKTTVDSASALFKSLDSAYSTFANSSAAKILGLDLPTSGKETPEKPKPFNADEFLKKVRNKEATVQEIESGKKALDNLNTIEQEMNRRANKKKADAEYAKKQAEEKKATKKKAAKENKKTDEEILKDAEKVAKESKKAAEKVEKEAKKAAEKAEKETKKTETEYAKTDGKVYGEGTSKFSGWDKNTTTVDAEEGRDYWSMNSNVSKSKVTDVVNTSSYSIGQTYIAGLLELKE